MNTTTLSRFFPSWERMVSIDFSSSSRRLLIPLRFAWKLVAIFSMSERANPPILLRRICDPIMPIFEVNSLIRSLVLTPAWSDISVRTTLRNVDHRGCCVFSYFQALNQTTIHFVLGLVSTFRATVFNKLVFPLPQSPHTANVNGVSRLGSDAAAAKASE